MKTTSMIKIDEIVLKKIHKDYARAIRKLRPFLDAKTGPWIAGGFCRRYVESPDLVPKGDIDVFFASREQLNVLFPLMKKALGERVISLTGDGSNPNFSRLVDAVDGQFFPTAEDMLAHFDITVSKLVSDGYSVWAFDKTVVDHLRTHTFGTKEHGDARRAIHYICEGYSPDASVVPVFHVLGYVDLYESDRWSKRVSDAIKRATPYADEINDQGAMSLLSDRAHIGRFGDEYFVSLRGISMPLLAAVFMVNYAANDSAFVGDGGHMAKYDKTQTLQHRLSEIGIANPPQWRQQYGDKAMLIDELISTFS